MIHNIFGVIIRNNIYIVVKIEVTRFIAYILESIYRPSYGELEDMKVQVQEFQGLYQATAVERDKLTELLSLLQSRLVFEILSCKDYNNEGLFVLKTLGHRKHTYVHFYYRLDEATLAVTESQSELQAQKRKNVLLEKQLGKSKVEQAQTKSG